jgi:hypothetical protein
MGNAKGNTRRANSANQPRASRSRPPRVPRGRFGRLLLHAGTGLEQHDEGLRCLAGGEPGGREIRHKQAISRASRMLRLVATAHGSIPRAGVARRPIRPDVLSPSPVSEPESPEGQEIQIELPPELENGIYANFALVHHTQHELTIDFCQLGVTPPQPGDSPKAKIVARIHIAPTFVMPLLQALSTNVARREDVLRQLKQGEQGGQE